MKVLKFGGTSVGSPENIRKVGEVLLQLPQNELTIVVVSAMGGVTDLLISCSEKAAIGRNGGSDYQEIFKAVEEKYLTTIRELIPIQSQSGVLSQTKILLNNLEDILKGVYLVKELSPKSLDYIQGFGERLSAILVSAYVSSILPGTEMVDGRDFIKTDRNFGNANVDFTATNKLISQHFSGKTGLFICPGFIASTPNEETATLGRGGSDFSASIIAAGLKASELEIWTDVSGIMTADPRLVKSSHSIASISYEDAMELSHFGAKVIYPPSIQPVLDLQIPIRIKNTMQPDDEGTLVTNEVSPNGSMIQGVSSVKDIVMINLSGSGMVGIPSFSYRLFRALSEHKVNVILITQASSEHTICVAIDEKDSEMAREAIEQEFEYEMSRHKIDPVEIEKELVIVALVGSGMKEQVGVSGKMFDSLSKNGISVKAIAQGSSERNISAVISKRHLKKALNSLHESFFLSGKKVMNLFIVGIGNVGSELIGQLLKQRQYLSENEHIELRLIGIANSRKMAFSEDGFDESEWHNPLENGEQMSMDAFISRMAELNKRNSIFIDNTANAEVAGSYLEILKNSISVVTPNKIACSSAYSDYLQLKKTAQKYNANFYFETNVGAGLPVISTLSDLIKSGDKIHKIQAVLSGSLNFIFNNFKKGVSFTDIVKQAKEEGYTEPDPREDLSGMDVMRKILILVRESGIAVEPDEVVK
ncbi:MAG: bifunctional aspartate kinase/homoserine dehydrogenase I, partial [Bacteroidota bacterium]